MADTKTFRLTSDRAAWLAAEAKRAEISENRIINALIMQAMLAGWRFGGQPVLLMESQQP